ncbi:MAG: glycosyltransferase family 9 protein [Magnetospirillum sp. WYHS-4]
MIGHRLAGHRFEANAFWRLVPGGMPRRWWLFRPFDWLARHWPVGRSRQGLLVIRMDGIGDMVLFRSSLDHYAEAFGVPREDIVVLGCKAWGELAETVFSGYRTMVIDEHRFAKRPWYRFGVALAVRRLNPAITVCDQFFRRPLMADSLAWIAGAPQTAMSLPYINEATRSTFAWYLSQASRVVFTGHYPLHEVARHYRFVSEILGREVPAVPPMLEWREREPKVPKGAPYVVVNPGSNAPGRRWPVDNYLKLADRLHAMGFRIVVVGTSGEKADVERLKAFAETSGVIDLIGQTTMDELMDLLKHAALVLTNDSGPAHLAVALGVRTLVVVGGGHFGCFFPYPEGIAPATVRFAWTAMDCYHCFWRCPKRTDDRDAFPCVAAVTPEQAWAKVEELLA